MSALDSVRAAAKRAPAIRYGIAQRREALAREVSARYGVTLHAHPRRPGVVVVSETDAELLHDAVTRDRGIDAVGRGYYLYLGGELDVVTAPDWACDPVSVAWLRLKVIAMYRPLRPVIRVLARWLNRL